MKKDIFLLLLFSLAIIWISSCKQVPFAFPQDWAEETVDSSLDSSLLSNSSDKKLNKYVYFQGESMFGQVIDDSNPDFLNFDQYSGFTIQFETKVPDKLTADDPFLTNKDWNSGSNPGWVIAVNGQSWKFNAGGNGRIDINADAPGLSDGKWHSIAVTVQKGGMVKLYQDDSLYKSGQLESEKVWTTGSDVKLACVEDITGHYKEKWGVSEFVVANIRVWDTVLEQNDMKKYAVACDTTIASDSPFYKNLVAWWRGNEGSGYLFKDYGPFHIDMMLYGQAQWVEQSLDMCNCPL